MSNDNTDAIWAKWNGLPDEGDRCPIHLIADILGFPLAEVARVLFRSYDDWSPEMKAKLDRWGRYFHCDQYWKNVFTAETVEIDSRALETLIYMTSKLADLPETTPASAEARSLKSAEVWALRSICLTMGEAAHLWHFTSYSGSSESTGLGTDPVGSAKFASKRRGCCPIRSHPSVVSPGCE